MAPNGLMTRKSVVASCSSFDLSMVSFPVSMPPASAGIAAAGDGLQMDHDLLHRIAMDREPEVHGLGGRRDVVEHVEIVVRRHRHRGRVLVEAARIIED